MILKLDLIVIIQHMVFNSTQDQFAVQNKNSFKTLKLCQYLNPSIYHIKTAWQAAVSKKIHYQCCFKNLFRMKNYSVRVKIWNLFTFHFSARYG